VQCAAAASCESLGEGVAVLFEQCYTSNSSSSTYSASLLHVTQTGSSSSSSSWYSNGRIERYCWAGAVYDDGDGIVPLDCAAA
jgi:hypothetical protein